MQRLPRRSLGWGYSNGSKIHILPCFFEVELSCRWSLHLFPINAVTSSGLRVAGSSGQEFCWCLQWLCFHLTDKNVASLDKSRWRCISVWSLDKYVEGASWRQTASLNRLVYQMRMFCNEHDILDEGFCDSYRFWLRHSLHRLSFQLFHSFGKCCCKVKWSPGWDLLEAQSQGQFMNQPPSKRNNMLCCRCCRCSLS